MSDTFGLISWVSLCAVLFNIWWSGLYYSGNYQYARPYKSGPPCGDCPNACDNKLCSKYLMWCRDGERSTRVLIWIFKEHAWIYVIYAPSETELKGHELMGFVLVLQTNIWEITTCLCDLSVLTQFTADQSWGFFDVCHFSKHRQKEKTYEIIYFFIIPVLLMI